MESIILKENDKAILWMVKSIDYHFFEVWIKIIGNSGKFKGEILCPKDEDFGVWAWNLYSLERAEKYYSEITSGERQITPMVES